MATGDRRDQFMAAIGTRYLLRLGEDTLRERPLPIRPGEGTRSPA